MEPEKIIKTIRTTQFQNDSRALDCAIRLVWGHTDLSSFTDILNELLIDPNHHLHQETARALQELKSPSSIPYIERVLKTHFDYLSYTCSESAAIAKWFSHLLADIGTTEAISMIELYAKTRTRVFEVKCNID